PHVVRHTYGSFPFEIYLADRLSVGWYDHDWAELPEITFLCRHKLKLGSRVFDLGAHQCVVALMLAQIVGPTGSVIALDANEHNATVGRRNQELNGIPQLRVLHAAADKQSGTLFFNTNLNGQVDDGTGNFGQVRVPAYSVDDLARQYGMPDVLFIDVEGFE